MNKLIITRCRNKILTSLVSNSKAIQMNLEEDGNQSILNNIYIGKVKNIVKNINAAFVEIGDQQIGYYSLTENTSHHFANTNHGKAVQIGDEIIVQISRDGVKTKAPVLSCYLNLTGKYCVLTSGKNLIGFSNKIADTEWKASIRESIEQVKEKDFGVIVRTNARNASLDMIINELNTLKNTYYQILDCARYRTCFTLLHKSPPAFVSSLRDTNAENLEEIITDEPDIFDHIKEYLTTLQPEDLYKLRLYQDPLLPLNKLYSLDSSLEGALNKKVWLKSGGYLVIEPTEALVVIDVNTGKYSGKKNVQDTILKINLEAAEEIGRQLCLRNLSGIIIIDFIDMERIEDRNFLLENLERILSKDSVKSTLVDMTKLNLVEITRKKLRKPLHEQIF